MEKKEVGGSSRSSSDFRNQCPICLGVITQDSYLDGCYHRFCYNCILRWIKVVKSKGTSEESFVKCPLCKKDFSIIYLYDGNMIQPYNIKQGSKNNTFFSESHKYRLQCYQNEPESGVLDERFKVSQYWKSCKYRQPNGWLQCWLRREIQALRQEEDVDIIVYHILGVIELFSNKGEEGQVHKHSPNHKQEEFTRLVSEAARPFLMERTERFVQEVELFLASGLTITSYDDAYKRQLGLVTLEDVSDSAERPVSGEQTAAAIYPYIFEDFDDESYEI